MESPSSNTPRDPRRRKYHIQAECLSYELPTSYCTRQLCRSHGDCSTSSRSVLKNVSCEALPGELTAVVGPSGSGKTSLLAVLAGLIHPSRVSGQVLVDGRPMEVSRFCRVSGYVAQEDTLFPLLTVEETLAYSARLRLRATTREAAAHVQELIKELGLDHVAGSRVSGVSGGERRRVSIGAQLVHDPAVLFLDEPTTGLDSAAALHIVKLLRSMAVVQGKMVVTTLHQPGFRILELLHRLLLIHGGSVRHQGPISLLESRLKHSGHCIPPHVNALEFAMDALDFLDSKLTVPESNTAAIRNSNPSSKEDNFHYTSSRLGEISTLSSRLFIKILNSSKKGDKFHYANSRLGEISILAGRCFTNAARTRELFAAKALQTLTAGLVLGTIFMDANDPEAKIGFFAFTLTFLLSSTKEGLPIFLRERRILEIETRRGAYRVSSYVAADALVFFPFLLAAAVLYAAPAYWLVGLRGETSNFLYFVVVVWLVMLTANSFVACFGALVPSYIMGSSVAAGVMGAFFLFSGYFISKDRIPKYWIFAHYLSLFKYPFEAMLLNEYGGEKGRKQCLSRGVIHGGDCVFDGGMLLRQQGVEDSQRWSHVGVMLGFIAAYRLLCYLILCVRCYRKGGV
ncbi:ABC transporter G family member 10-like [Zingiber officinale]|nr:ABC transporter G family member 10-like [Zingiber officinale]